MIYTILSLFAFYELSAGSRRLLQAQAAVPQYVPVSTQAAAQVTVPASTQTGPAAHVSLPPFVSLPPLPSAASEKLECVMSYTTPGNCAGTIKTLQNPVENFKVMCAAEGACAMSNIVMEYAPGGFTERIEGIWFSEAYAGYKTTITIRNLQGGNALLLDRLECQGRTSCEGLTIILENAAVNDVECGYPEDCNGCFIKNGPLDPNPTPCYGF